MFEGAKRSADAKASVLGPHGPWFERPVPGAAPKRPLTLLVPALAAQTAILAAAFVAIVTGAAIKGAPQWPAGAVFGVLIASGFVIFGAGRARSALETTYEAPPGVAFKTPSQSRNRGADRATFPAVYTVFVALVGPRNDSGFAGFGGAFLFVIGATCAWQLVRAIQVQRQAGVPLGVEVPPRAFSMFTGRSVYVAAPPS